MCLPNDLTLRQLGDLAVKMAIMDPSDLVKLVLEHPCRVNAVALLAVTAAALIEGDGGEGEG